MVSAVCNSAPAELCRPNRSFALAGQYRLRDRRGVGDKFKGGLVCRLTITSSDRIDDLPSTPQFLVLIVME
jgi:hypothetical protein